MSVVRIFGVGIGLTAVLTVATACGSSEKSSPTSSSSMASSTSTTTSTSAAAATTSTAPPGTAPLGDYTYLLLQANDVGADATPSGPAMQNPGGVPGAALTFFMSPDRARSFDDLVIIFIDPATAAQQTQDRGKDLGKYVTGTPQPLDVGTNGQITVGPSPDKTKAVTYVTYSEGKVGVDLEFDSGPNDPAPLDFVLDVARKQDALVKSRLPS